MVIRGWVYVISNKAMPEIVKIGYTTKDPSLRASELNNTGSPHPYNLEYDVLVEDPRKVEQQIHAALADVREGKEWFRCSIKDAIEAIKRVGGAYILLEQLPNAGYMESLTNTANNLTDERFCYPHKTWFSGNKCPICALVDKSKSGQPLDANEQEMLRNPPISTRHVGAELFCPKCQRYFTSQCCPVCGYR